MTTTNFEDIKRELEAKKKSLTTRLNKINRHLRQADGPLSADSQEQAQELENEEVLQALGTSGREEVKKISMALQRIEAGTYNECSECGDDIAERRLQALPYTHLCIECATEAEANSS